MEVPKSIMDDMMDKVIGQYVNLDDFCPRCGKEFGNRRYKVRTFGVVEEICGVCWVEPRTAPTVAIASEWIT